MNTECTLIEDYSVGGDSEVGRASRRGRRCYLNENYSKRSIANKIDPHLRRVAIRHRCITPTSASSHQIRFYL
ncbi:hypothetical protein RDWZM_008155, partial [Blomia tropicalis]